MADIEERAEKWAQEHSARHGYADVEGFGFEDLIAAYLAGSGRTQADYTADYTADYCGRCVCTCGAR